MDITELTRFLAPALPFLLKTGQEALTEGAEALGSDVWDAACRLWRRLWPNVRERPAGREAAEDLGRRPDDDRVVSAFEVQLEKVLDADPDLAAEVERLWRQMGSVTAATGQGSVGIGGSVTGSVIVTGDHNAVES